MGPLSHSDHRRFVETEHWEHKGTARAAQRTGDHHRYTLVLATGEVLYTRVSHGSGQIGDPGLVASILREQLRVSEDDFYRCVRDGVLPPRPQPPTADRPTESIDGKLMRNLVRKVGLNAEEIAVMTKAEAVQAWQDYLTGGAH